MVHYSCTIGVFNFKLMSQSRGAIKNQKNSRPYLSFLSFSNSYTKMFPAGNSICGCFKFFLKTTTTIQQQYRTIYSEAAAATTSKRFCCPQFPIKLKKKLASSKGGDTSRSHNLERYVGSTPNY